MSKSSESANIPQVPDWVIKKQDYLFFIDCVRDGLWNNNSYLAELCSVDRDTIASWKKTEQVIQARKEASKEIRKAIRNRGDVKDRMKEAGMVIEPEKLEVGLKVIIEDYTS